MKKSFFITGIIFTLLLRTSFVYACEPCPETLNFEETVEKSDLIIISQRTDYWQYEQKVPDSINVKIIEVLKGDINQNQITVNSWDGMCPYGIDVDDKIYIMLLQKRDNQYDAVNFGCSVKTFLVENNMVDFDGNTITLDDFTAKFGSQASRQIIEDKSQQQTSYLYYIIPVIVVLIIISLIILRMRKK